MANIKCSLALAVLLCSAGVLHAQSGAPVLKMKEVTEAALIDALAIEEPASEQGAKTRSIRPTARSNPTSGKAAAGKSNLLITFATNSSELTSESKEALSTVAKAMQSDKLAGFAFSIEGHADPRGAADLNQKLSEARAKSVVEHLVASHGILADRLEPVGKGASEPLNSERPDAPENRRVTIVTKRQ